MTTFPNAPSRSLLHEVSLAALALRSLRAADGRACVGNENLAMLVVTYDFGIARRLADRTLVVEDGRIVERGDTTTPLKNSKTEPARTLGLIEFFESQQSPWRGATSERFRTDPPTPLS